MPDPAANSASGPAWLSAEDLARFRRDGFVILRGLFGAPAMRRITTWTEEVIGFPEAPGQSMFYYEDSVIDPDRRVLSRIEYFADHHKELGALTRGPELCGRAAVLFGEPAVLFKEKINMKLPGGQGFEPHQDMQAGWNAYGDLHITAMVTIDPANEENGCLELAAGHHKHGLIGEMWKPLSGAQLAGIAFAKIPAAPGDVVFFDSFAPHRSAPNYSDKPRRILYLTYGKASDGDRREEYFAAKRKGYPPDIEREPGERYEYKV